MRAVLVARRVNSLNLPIFMVTPLNLFVAFGHTPRIILSTCILAGALFAADVPATLQVSSTTVPPGGTAQIRILLATPQPISNGAFSIDLDPAFFGDIADVQVFSAAGDATGTAAINGRHVDVQFSSHSGGVGRLPDLPLATVAVPILPGAVLGTIGAVTLDPGTTRWMAPNNAVYNLAVQPGSVTASGSLAIQDVTPGGGLLPAGTVVRVTGFGFRPDTVIDVRGVAIAATNYAGPAEIDLPWEVPPNLPANACVRAMWMAQSRTMSRHSEQSPPAKPRSGFCRSFHFELIRRFRPIPFQTGSEEPGASLWKTKIQPR